MTPAAKSSIFHEDRYSFASTVQESGIFLAASSVTAAKVPFFKGVLNAPRRTADLFLALAHVVETRFFTPPGMLRRLLAQRDPVLTCDAEILRLEGFSACASVYVRLDLLQQSFQSEGLSPGTSNVDFNAGMKAALANVLNDEPTRIELSADGLTVESPSIGKAFERRVELPIRWVKSFQEVQSTQSRMTSRFRISGPAAQRFLASLPGQPTRSPVWLSSMSNTFRLSQTQIPGAIKAGNLERLRILKEVVRHAIFLEVFSSDDGCTAWQLETPDSRLFLVLSPDSSRGFSGEGQSLKSLAMNSSQVARTRALLRWRQNVTPVQLAAELNLPLEAVETSLAQAAASGLVGFDLARASFFHRELPYNLKNVEKLNPRLAGARRLLQDASFEFDNDGAWIRSGSTEYRLRKSEDGIWICACPWASRYGQSRGPCKHALALQIRNEVADAE